MIVTCENCQTKFNVPDDKIGPEGRKVRCSSCKHTWHVMPLVAGAPEEKKKEPVVQYSTGDKIEPKVEFKQKPEAKPAAAKPTTDVKEEEGKFLSTSWLKIAASVLIILNFVAFVFFNKEIIGQTSFYDMVGQYDTKAVEIQSHDITALPAEKGSNLQIAWVVKNTSAKMLRMPIVRFRLYDANVEMIGEKRNAREDLRLNGGEEKKFKDTLIHPVKVARYFTVEIGNNSELAAR